MRRGIVLGILLIGLTAVLPPAAAGQESDAKTSRENKMLEAELALAKSSQFYFLFNLKEKRIEIKSRGVVLRSWAPERIKFWGKPVPFEARALAKKTALTAPQRRVINPGQDSSATPQGPPAKPGEFELEALEVKDMPKTYTLEMDDGTKIYVLPRNKGLKGIWNTLKWYIGLPIKTVVLHMKNQTMTLIQISFIEPKEGQAMYWAMTEGLKGWIWFPRED